MKGIRREQFRRFVAVMTVTGVIGLLVLLILYSKIVFDIGVLCPLHEIFGIDCPGCGGTRMAVALINLNFYQAFRWNPLLFLTLPICGVIYIWQVYTYVRYNKLWDKLDTFLIGYLIVIGFFTILRNMPVFNWLAPTLVG